MAARSLTGYGPSIRHRLLFDGDESKYELWEVRFLGHMRSLDLYKTLVPAEGDDADPDTEKNAKAFGEMATYLDDRSLSLVLRDAKDDGRKALQILRTHYQGRSKPRVISLYTELTTLRKDSAECVTDYVIRAETAKNSLREAGETVSDTLLVAMILKGLPPEYDTFGTIVTQKDPPMDLKDFKVALRAQEEREKLSKPSAESSDSVLRSDSSSKNPENLKCYACGRMGHKSFECKNRKKGKWCYNCRNNTHYTNQCRRKDAAKVTNTDDSSGSQGHSFAFRVSVDYAGVCNPTPYKLLVDCGATAHILNDKSKFECFDKNFVPEDHFIELADGSRTNQVVKGKGKASVLLHDDKGINHKVVLENALYVPSYSQDIFAVHAATEKGASLEITPEGAELRAPDGTKFEVKKEGRLYYLNKAESGSTKTKSHTVEEWHRVLGHCNVKDVEKLEPVVEGMKITGNEKFDCETCIKGKMSQYRNREPDKRATTPLEVVYCDLAGPVTPTAREGFKYALSFVDDYTGVNMVYFLKQKSDTTAATEKFLADVAAYGKVKCIRSDNGGEFIGKSFEDLLVKNQIKHERTAPHSPHQNGTVERSWRTVFEMARCLLIESGVSKEFWTYAVMCGVYIRNRCYNERIGMTPFEALTSQRPNLSGMYIFGTVCFAYVQEKKKLDDRCEKGIFMGYDKGSPAYLVYIPERNIVRKVRCVKFTNKFPVVREPEYILEPEFVEVDETVPGELVENVPVENPQGEHPEVGDGAVGGERRYPQRERKEPGYLRDYVRTVDYCYRMAYVPSSYSEAFYSPNGHKWQKAMDAEMKALKDNETFELTTLPEGRTVVGGRWVYAVKMGPEGDEQYKARFVAKGYSQVPNIDYHETFSPTARITSIRMLMQIAAQEDMLVHQMDVKTAYLNAPIDHEIYIEQPEGYERRGRNGEKLVCKLKRSLYGLKQSGRNWNNMLDMHLKDEGFSQSEVDTCVYYKWEGKSKTIVIVWVDDIIIATSSESALKRVKDSLSKMFKMKDLGRLSWFLGIEFKYQKGVIEMNQTKYLEKILKRFNMSDCKPKSTPCDVGSNTVTSCDHKELADATLYREIVGSLIYCMSATRPDICYVVTYLSQYMSEPTQVYMSIAKRVLRYLKGTMNKSLRFVKSENPLTLYGYCDADWGSEEDRKSITGYVFKMNEDEQSSVISYKSKKQQSVALSTCEAEYMALSAATQEVKFLTQLFLDMSGEETSKGVKLYVDNQGAIALAKNPVHHQRSKHIDIRYHYVRQEVQNGSIDLDYIPSSENIADMFTKPVSRVKMDKFMGP